MRKYPIWLKWVVTCIIAILILFSTIIYAGLLPFNWEDIFVACGLKHEASQTNCVRFLSVGQGDCTLILNNGKAALIDCAPVENAIIVADELENLGIEQLEYIFITHPHDDHIGGLRYIINHFKVNNIISPPIDDKKLSEKSKEPELNNSYFVGDAEITVLYYEMLFKNDNDCGTVYRVETDELSLIFTGDLTQFAERTLVDSNSNLDCDILKAGHHGSANSTCDEFIRATGPQCVIFSSGVFNTFGHPSPKVIENLNNKGIAYFRTDSDGHITLLTQERRIFSEYFNQGYILS